jgi:hypothetical protein
LRGNVERRAASYFDSIFEWFKCRDQAAKHHIVADIASSIEVESDVDSQR